MYLLLTHMLVYAHTRQNLDTLLSVSLSHTEKHTVCVRIIPLSLLCTFHETRTHIHTHTHTHTHTPTPRVHKLTCKVEDRGSSPSLHTCVCELAFPLCVCELPFPLCVCVCVCVCVCDIAHPLCVCVCVCLCDRETSLCVCVCVCVCERENERKRKRERERERETADLFIFSYFFLNGLSTPFLEKCFSRNVCM